MLVALLCAPVLPAQSDYDSFLQDFHKYLDHNDMTNMGHVYIITNLDAQEISDLTNQDE